MDTIIDQDRFIPRSASELWELAAQKRNEATQAAQVYSGAQNKYADYVKQSQGRNPVAAIIDAAAPKRDTDKEERLRKTAMWASINDGIAAIGKSIANAGGVRTSPLQPNRPLYNSLSELSRLDDIYRQEGYRYDGLKLSEALRVKQTDDANAANQLVQAQDMAARTQKEAEALDLLRLKEQSADERAALNNVHKERLAAKQNETRLRAAGIGAAAHRGDQIKPLYHIPFEGKRVPITDSDQLGLLQLGKVSLTDFAAKTPIEQQAQIAELYTQLIQKERRIDVVKKVVKEQGANAITYTEAIALFPEYKDKPSELAEIMTELGVTLTIQ